MPGFPKGIALCAALLLFASCAKESTDEMADDMADTTAMAPAGMSMASLAGTWNMRTMMMDSDSTRTEYQYVVSESGITLVRDGFEPVPVTASIEGDAMTTDAGPFPSSIREGEMVTVHGTYHMEGAMLVGHITAHYQTAGPDSVLELRTEGTRAP